MDDDRYTRITLRIPKDLHQALQASADATSKSLNAEIINRLSASFEQEIKGDRESVLAKELELARALTEKLEATVATFKRWGITLESAEPTTHKTGKK